MWAGLARGMAVIALWAGLAPRETISALQAGPLLSDMLFAF